MFNLISPLNINVENSTVLLDKSSCNLSQNSPDLYLNTGGAGIPLIQRYLGLKSKNPSDMKLQQHTEETIKLKTS